MSKHTHHETNQEQRAKKDNVAPPFHYDPYQLSGTVKSKGVSTQADEDHGDIKLRAYQIHLEKGGSDLDNWLEAERSLKILK